MAKKSDTAGGKLITVSVVGLSGEYLHYGKSCCMICFVLYALFIILTNKHQYFKLAYTVLAK